MRAIEYTEIIGISSSQELYAMGTRGRADENQNALSARILCIHVGAVRYANFRIGKSPFLKGSDIFPATVNSYQGGEADVVIDGINR